MEDRSFCSFFSSCFVRRLRRLRRVQQQQLPVSPADQQSGGAMNLVFTFFTSRFVLFRFGEPFDDVFRPEKSLYCPGQNRRLQQYEYTQDEILLMSYIMSFNTVQAMACDAIACITFSRRPRDTCIRSIYFCRFSACVAQSRIHLDLLSRLQLWQIIRTK